MICIVNFLLFLLHFLRSHFETGFGDWNRKREISLIIYSKLQRVRAQVFIHRGGGLCGVGIRPSRRAYLELH